MIIFVDMDGVLVDFVSAALKVHDAKYPWDSSNFGEFDIAGMLGIPDEDFWRPLDSHDFWANLNPTKEGSSIVSLLSRLPIRTYVLSSPTRSKGCYSGKYDWIRSWMPFHERRFILGTDKHLMAGPDRILIDDADKNVDAWTGAGGKAILFPRDWNRRHADQASFDFAKELEALL